MYLQVADNLPYVPSATFTFDNLCHNDEGTQVKSSMHMQNKLDKHQTYIASIQNTYRIRQNIRGGKLSRFINNMHYVGITFAVCRLKLRVRLCNVDFRVYAN